MKRLTALATLVLTATAARAQWTTETYQLQPGWNAIYALNDCSHVSLDTLLAGVPEITQLWRWVPSNLTSQFIGSPEQTVEGAEWKVWQKGLPANTTMTTMLPNYGYLVYVTDITNVNLSLTGRAILPQVDWRSSGSNLVGFPAKTGTPLPLFGGSTSGYFSPLTVLGYNSSTTKIYQYVGGPISDTAPVNPAQIAAPTSAAVVRGKAYWVNLAIHSDFVSPLKVQLDHGTGMDFGTRGGQQKIMLTNTTTAQRTVTLTPTASGTPPAGQQAVEGMVPLLMRVWNATTKAYEFQPVSAPLTATLAPGASTSWTLVANRAAMTASEGALYATVLRVTDGGLSDIPLPVSAVKTGFGGLWVGEAVIGKVQNQLQTFQRNEDGTYVVDDAGRHVLLSSENGKTNTAREFRLRLIVHVDATGTAKLLSNVYYGVLDNAESSLGFTLRQKGLKPDALGKATRITAVHLPLDVAATLAGPFTPAGQTSVTVSLPHTDATNPFLHTYHPDHDNLDARFSAASLADGVESHAVTRTITLTMDAGSLDGDPAWGANSLTGSYAESVSGLHKDTIGVEGRFTLRRLSEVTTLIP